ncbi:hypothetical protein BCV70DRAFT_98635 [Testicularia cyperi]|uniref:Uncharacterized protein n=1 Tax=Testicularia cyperi TaxID=1882483 RepID=A0A317XS68_9BASI|nr:hypothetical protein BCV70DRAFT_98635 [Testicularia cyperi]
MPCKGLGTRAPCCAKHRASVKLEPRAPTVCCSEARKELLFAWLRRSFCLLCLPFGSAVDSSLERSVCRVFCWHSTRLTILNPLHSSSPSAESCCEAEDAQISTASETTCTARDGSSSARMAGSISKQAGRLHWACACSCARTPWAGCCGSVREDAWSNTDLAFTPSPHHCTVT